MIDLTFKLRHSCPFSDFSRKHPEVLMAQWCNKSTEFFEIELKDVESFERLQADLNDFVRLHGGRLLSKSFGEKNVQLVAKTCTCAKLPVNVSDFFDKHNCLEVQPIVYLGGTERYRIIAFRDSDVRNLFKNLESVGEVEVLSRKTMSASAVQDAFPISMTTLFADLTEKQASSLVAALEGGYYQVPKKATAEEIARRYKVPRTTFEEHIRKAESKLLRAVAPYVEMYARSTQRKN